MNDINQKPPSKTRRSSTDNVDDVDDDLNVELAEVHEALSDPIAHERISNYRRIVRLNSAHVSKLNTLLTKVSVRGVLFPTGGGLTLYLNMKLVSLS